MLDAGQCYVTPVGTPVGIKADTEGVYVEVLLRKETVMNPILKDKEVFALKDLIPYQEGKIVNMDTNVCTCAPLSVFLSRNAYTKR